MMPGAWTITSRWPKDLHPDDDDTGELQLTGSAASAVEPVLVAVYLRVSSDEQRENETIKTQRDVIERFLGGRPELRVHDWYLDDGVTGTLPLQQRPAGQRMASDAVNGRFRRVLVARADRLGRDLSDLLNVRDFFAGLDIELVGVVEALGDELNFDILAVLAKHERKRFLARSREGMDRAAREGRYTGGIVAYGYRVAGEGKNAHLVPDTEPLWGILSASDVIGRMYERAALDGWSCQRIAAELNDLQIPTHYQRDQRGYRQKSTRALWRASRVRNMLVKTIYRGELVYGRRSRQHREVIAAPLPAIVSLELWNAAQQTLSRNRMVSTRQTATYLLRGLVTCTICGLRYCGTYGRDGQRYACGGKQRDRGTIEGRCPSRSIAARDIEPLILADLRQYLLEPNEIIDELLRELSTPDSVDWRPSELAVLNERLAELDGQALRAKRLAVRGSLEDAELDEILADVARNCQAIEERVRVMDVGPPTSPPALAPDLRKVLAERVDDMTPEEWRDLAPMLIRGIEATTTFDDLERKRLHLRITYNFARPSDGDIRQSHDDTGRGSSRR